MKQQICQRSKYFLLGTEDDIAAVKLIKYRYYVSKYPSEAADIKDEVLDVALKNRLIGEYETIYRGLGKVMNMKPEYKALRQQLVNKVKAPIHSLTINQKSQNNEALGEDYFTLANIYFEYGQYQQALNYYTHLFKDKHCKIAKSQFYQKFALCIYYIHDYADLIRFHKLSLSNPFMSEHIDYCIIKDLKALQRNPKLTSAFKTIFEQQFDKNQIMKNNVLSYQDMGFLYSLLALAYRERDELKKEISWSSGIQIMLLRRNYKRLLQLLVEHKQYKQFHPFFVLIYDKCLDAIFSRIFVEVVSSFQRCPYTKLKELTGISEEKGDQIISTIQSNALILKDPIDKAYVYKKFAFPLYAEVKRLEKKLQQAFDREVEQSQREDRRGPMMRYGMGFH